MKVTRALISVLLLFERGNNSFFGKEFTASSEQGLGFAVSLVLQVGSLVAVSLVTLLSSEFGLSSFPCALCVILKTGLPRRLLRRGI
jgi:hypothetical protein